MIGSWAIGTDLNLLDNQSLILGIDLDENCTTSIITEFIVSYDLMDHWMTAVGAI